MASAVAEYAERNKELLQIERDCERDELVSSVTGARLTSLEANGLAITRLSIQSVSSDIGGRQVVTLATHAKREIFATRITTGDIVILHAYTHARTKVLGSGQQQTQPQPQRQTTRNEGVLTNISEHSVDVALDSPLDDDDVDNNGQHYAILKSTSDVSHKRYMDALDLLQKVADNPSHPSYRLVSILLGEGDDVEPAFDKNLKIDYNDNSDNGDANDAAAGLNDEQQRAVEMCLRAKDLAVIHGPPGTGKTHTLVSYILKELSMGGGGSGQSRRKRILVVAPSNVAVDNIAYRLSASASSSAFNSTSNSGTEIQLVRAGHSARITQDRVYTEQSLEMRVARSDEAQLAREVRGELAKLDGELNRVGRRGEGSRRRGIRAEQRALRRELRVRERQAVVRVLQGCDVLLATISGAGARVMDLGWGPNAGGDERGVFDVVVVDEAAQALEAATWPALLRARKVILAGDPFQLGATVKSVAAAKAGLDQSLLDRIFQHKALKTRCVTMLTTQYRMHHLISNWSSSEFYDGRLLAHDSVAERDLTTLPGWQCDKRGGNNGEDQDGEQEQEQDDAGTYFPMILIDTAGGDCEEEDENVGLSSFSAASDAGTGAVTGLGSGSGSGSGSKRNPGEAGILKRVVDQFVHGHGVHPGNIGVISPYAAQVKLMRNELHPLHGKELEVATIDAFQGREKEVICLSLVRSNESGEVGFLSEDRRLNVAITRAKRCVVVVCDSETVCNHALIERFVAYVENHGIYRSAVVEFQDIVGTFSQLRRPRQAIDAAESHPKQQKTQSSSRQRSNNGSGNEIKTHRGKVPQTAEMRNGKKRNARDKRKMGGNNKDEDDEDDEQRIETIRKKMRKEIERFLNNEYIVEKWFSKNLSALERRIVHEIAEEKRVLHASHGEGDNRQVRIWKKRDEVAGNVKSDEKEEDEAEGLEKGHENMNALLSGIELDSVNADGEEETERGSAGDNGVEEAKGEASSEYSSANGMLSELRKMREQRQRQWDAIGSGNGSGGGGGGEAQDVGEGSGGGGSNSNKKGRKKKGKAKRNGAKQGNDEEEDSFEETLRKYGSNNDSGLGSSSNVSNSSSSSSRSRFSPTVSQIVNGVLMQPTGTSSRTADNRRQANSSRLADKLTEHSQKRKKKAKK